MPEKSGAGKKERFSTGSDAQEHKRDLINSLESLRGGRGQRQPVRCESQPTASTSELPSRQDDLQYLHNELRLSRTTNSMLENDLKRMEQKLLDTIAENGRLKQMLDKVSSSSAQRLPSDDRAEDILRQLQQSRNDHFMLTQALIDSENEIARLTKVLEKLTGRLLAA